MATFEYKMKPTLFCPRSFDLSTTGLKQIIVGNDCSGDFNTKILLTKLDTPYTYLSLSPPEWYSLENHFEIFELFFNNSGISYDKLQLSEKTTISFKQLFAKPTLEFLNEDGKFLLQSPLFNELKKKFKLINLYIKESEETSMRLKDCHAGENKGDYLCEELKVFKNKLEKS